jgi:hypothetical protein
MLTATAVVPFHNYLIRRLWMMRRQEGFQPFDEAIAACKIELARFNIAKV